jgi:transitional endoplasmic reticulum ATPase
MAQKVTEPNRQQILAKLAELGGGAFSPEDDIVSEGKQLVLPEGMTMRRAIDFLAERLTADQEVTAFSRRYRYRPWDGGVCTWRALKRVFGMVGLSGTEASFGEDPPEMREVPIGFKQTETVPWGTFTLPAMDNLEITPGGYRDAEYGTLFVLNINAPRKYRAQVEGIFTLVANELETASIYKGKAFDGQEMPEFLDLSGVNPAKVIYAPETLVQLEANVWSVLKYRKELEAAGISRKRSALFYGPYGTGKTLGGFLTAQKAIEAGWTFLYARPGRDDLIQVMNTAKLYQPACVFVEDLDSMADPEHQSSDNASQLLDIFDGITSKGTELMVVLTTNHPDRIHKGMLRPGRLDAVIEIAELDQDGVSRLIQSTVPTGALAQSINWDEVYAEAQGMLPAYIKELGDRAYRYALSRTGQPEGIQLTTQDLVNAAHGLRPQLNLMEGAAEHEGVDSLSEAFKQVAKQAQLEVRSEQS